MVDIYEILRRDQDGTSDYVKEFLASIKVPYEVDSYGNIFNLNNENVPLLSAHMDTVRKNDDFCIGAFLTEEEDSDKISSGGILGGDDKCGVYIILKALEEGKKVNFIFSRDEEIGCLGIKALLKPNWVENKVLADKIRNNCLWCLVLDRRGNSDIICTKNSYGSKEFEEALKKASDEGGFGYKPESGLCSDANTIRDFISTANISVGYFKPHSKDEYIVKADLQKAYDYTIYLIDNLTYKFEASKVTYNYSGSHYYGGYYNGYYGSYYGKSEASRYYDTLRKNARESIDRSTYDYDYDDYDGYDYSGWSWKDWKDYDTKKSKKGCKCAFCGYALEDHLEEISMPDGKKFNICEYCLEDLEDEVKRLKPIFINHSTDI